MSGVFKHEITHTHTECAIQGLAINMKLTFRFICDLFSTGLIFYSMFINIFSQNIYSI